jgi:hypothetical protein
MRALGIRIRSRTATLAVALVVAVAAVSVAALAVGSRGSGKASGVDPIAVKRVPHSVGQGVTPPSATPDAPPVSSGGPNEDALLRRVVAGTDHSIVVNAVLGAPPEGFQEAPQFGEVGHRWLYIEMRADGTEGGLVEPNWEAMLVAGAYRDLAHAANLPDLLGYTVQLQFPDSSLSAPDSTVIAQPFTHNVITGDQRAADAVKAHVRQIPGLHGTSMRLLHAASPAVVETLTVTNPTTLLSAGLGSLQQSVFGEINDYDGILVRIVDSNGDLVATAAYSTRLGIGTGWSKPGIAPSSP